MWEEEVCWCFFWFLVIRKTSTNCLMMQFIWVTGKQQNDFVAVMCKQIKNPPKWPEQTQKQPIIMTKSKNSSVQGNVFLLTSNKLFQPGSQENHLLYTNKTKIDSCLCTKLRTEVGVWFLCDDVGQSSIDLTHSFQHWKALDKWHNSDSQAFLSIEERS